MRRLGLLDSGGYLRCRLRPAGSEQSVRDRARQYDQHDRCNLFRPLHWAYALRSLSYLTSNVKRSASKLIRSIRNGHERFKYAEPEREALVEGN